MRIYRTVLSVLLFGAACMNGRSEEPHRGMRDFDFIKESNPWLTSVNAAGLGTLQMDRTSVAGISSVKEDGGLAGIEKSGDSFLVSAMTESFVKISDRITFYGKLSWEYFTGKNMGGPVLMDPSYNPVNFYESTLETVGNKNKELYGLSGGISYAIDSKWSLGAKIDYEAGNYAKRKDPRFRSIWLDLDVSAGVKFSPSESFSVGLSAEYERTLETLSGSTYGTTDKQYFILVDYGGFYGRYQYFDGDKGYVPASTASDRPMFNAFYGASLQIQAGKTIKAFNELRYLNRSGYYGKRASSSVLFCEFGGNVVQYGLVLDIPSGEDIHRIRLDASYEGLKNEENNYRYNTTVGENTVIEYFGSREVLSRTDLSGGIAYTGWLGTGGLRPEWEFGASAGANSRRSEATVYPYFRRSNVTTFSSRLHGKKNFIVGNNIFTVGAEASFAAGFGTAKDDGILASSTSDAPVSGDIYLNRDFEYKTISQAGGTLNFRYTRLIKGRAALYADIRDSYAAALKKPDFLPGNYRNSLIVTIGCTF